MGAAFPKRKPAAEDRDPHRKPRWVRLWEGDSPFQVTRLWITGCRAKMQPFPEKAPGGLGWDLVVRTRRKRAWCFHANRQLSSEQRVGGGPFRGRGTEPVSQKVRSTTNGRTTCLEASAAASQTQALATVGLCLQHRAWPGPRGRGQAPHGCDQASLRAWPGSFKAGCTPLSRGKPRSGGVFLQDTLLRISGARGPLSRGPGRERSYRGSHWVKGQSLGREDRADANPEDIRGAIQWVLCGQ